MDLENVHKKSGKPSSIPVAVALIDDGNKENSSALSNFSQSNNIHGDVGNSLDPVIMDLDNPGVVIESNKIDNFSKGEEGPEDIKRYTETVKRRRRSTVLEAPPQESTASSASSQSSTTNNVVAPSTARRKSVARRSVIHVPPSSLDDQVTRIVTENNGGQKWTLQQLTDIILRQTLLQLCTQTPFNEQLLALKGSVIVGSEQFASQAVKELSKKSGLEELVPLPKRFKKERTARKNTQLQDLQYLRWLLEKYKSESDRLLGEKNKWKELRKERVQLHTRAKRAVIESRSGGSRISEDQFGHLSTADRAFVSSAPDYNKTLARVAQSVDSYVYTVSKLEKSILRINRVNAACLANIRSTYDAKKERQREVASPKTLLRNFHANFSADCQIAT